MAEVQVGTLAVAWGLVTGATGSGMGTFTPQSADFTVNSKSVETPNGVGQTINKTFYDFKQELSMEVIPTGTTLALAKAANILPVPGSIITVTDAGDTELTATNSAKYIFVEGSKKKSATGAVTLSFKLEQWVDADVAVVLA